MTDPRSEAGGKARAAMLADAIEHARRADPPGTGTKLEITHDDWDKVMVPALRAFAASATQRSADYAAKNPLGGPARMFEVMAERIRAGEDYDAVLADYDLHHGPSAWEVVEKCAEICEKVVFRAAVNLGTKKATASTCAAAIRAYRDKLRGKP